MHKYLSIIIAAIMVLFAGTALADNNHDTYYNYNDPVTYNQNPTATATGGNATGGSATIQSGAIRNDNNVSVGNGIGNFSPKAEATIERGAVQNYNANVGINKQMQGQMQGQLQGQMQGQQMNNGQYIAPSQEVTIINPENKRPLPGYYQYAAPGYMEYRGPYEKGIAGKFKPWEKATLWSKESLKGMTSSFDSASCKVYPVTKKDEATETLNVKKSTEPVICYIICTAENDVELWADAATKALAAGGMTIEEVAYAVTYSNKSSGWNIGFGGGVSAVNGGNDVMGGSVGGGTGVGSVVSEPKENIKAMFVVR